MSRPLTVLISGAGIAGPTVQADSHKAADGIAVGTATLFDSDGPFGSGLVTAVSNPAAQIDFSDPFRHPADLGRSAPLVVHRAGIDCGAG